MNVQPYNDTCSFLNQHYYDKSSGDEITHTKIGNKDLNISGGAYTIPNEKSDEFYSYYYQDVFVRKKNFYLTVFFQPALQTSPKRKVTLNEIL